MKNQLKEAGAKLIVIDFFATWCGPCKIIAPRLEELAAEYEGRVVVLKVCISHYYGFFPIASTLQLNVIIIF